MIALLPRFELDAILASPFQLSQDRAMRPLSMDHQLGVVWPEVVVEETLIESEEEIPSSATETATFSVTVVVQGKPGALTAISTEVGRRWVIVRLVTAMIAEIMHAVVIEKPEVTMTRGLEIETILPVICLPVHRLVGLQVLSELLRPPHPILDQQRDLLRWTSK